MVPSWFGILHNFVIVVATVHGVVADAQNICMAGPVHVQVCVVEADVVWVDCLQWLWLLQWYLLGLHL